MIAEYSRLVIRVRIPGLYRLEIWTRKISQNQVVWPKEDGIFWPTEKSKLQ